MEDKEKKGVRLTEYVKLRKRKEVCDEQSMEERKCHTEKVQACLNIKYPKAGELISRPRKTMYAVMVNKGFMNTKLLMHGKQGLINMFQQEVYPIYAEEVVMAEVEALLNLSLMKHNRYVIAHDSGEK